jgi:hypothetical protein
MAIIYTGLPDQVISSIIITIVLSIIFIIVGFKIKNRNLEYADPQYYNDERIT